MVDVRTTEGDSGRAPTGQITKPGDLLKEADGLELRFGYFPSADKIRLLVLHAPDVLTRWESRLSKPPSNEPLRQWEGPLPFPKAGVTLDAPALSDGMHALAVTLLSNNGQRREIHRTFERKHGSSGFRVLRCLWGALPPNPRHLSHWANSMVEAFGLPLADGQCCR